VVFGKHYHSLQIISTYYNLSSVTLPVGKCMEPEPRVLKNLFSKPWKKFLFNVLSVLLEISNLWVRDLRPSQ